MHFLLRHHPVGFLTGIFQHSLHPAFCRAADQVFHIHVPQRKKQKRILINPGADSVQNGRHMLAHIGIVGAGAGKMDFLRGGKQAVGTLGEQLFQLPGKLSGGQLLQGGNSMVAQRRQVFPSFLIQLVDGNFDLIRFGGSRFV